LLFSWASQSLSLGLVIVVVEVKLVIFDIVLLGFPEPRSSPSSHQPVNIHNFGSCNKSFSLDRWSKQLRPSQRQTIALRPSKRRTIALRPSQRRTIVLRPSQRQTIALRPSQRRTKHSHFYTRKVAIKLSAQVKGYGPQPGLRSQSWKEPQVLAPLSRSRSHLKKKNRSRSLSERNQEPEPQQIYGSCTGS